MSMGTSVALRFYLAGYSGLLLPRRLRRVLAGRVWHRAWLAGHMGIYEQEGRNFSVSDRSNLLNRKSGEHGYRELIAKLIRPYQ